MFDLPDWLQRFLETTEERQPGPLRLWPERSPEDLNELVRQQRLDGS